MSDSYLKQRSFSAKNKKNDENTELDFKRKKYKKTYTEA